MSKRTYCAAFRDKPQLRLKLACTTTAPGEPAQLKADEQVVCLLSSLAGDLPETDEWDLSGLLVDGQPVSRAIVVAWLNAAYRTVYAADFEAQEPDEDPGCSVEGLYLLLSFADAVGSTTPVLSACCSRLQSLQLHAQLGQQQVALDTDGTSYFFGGFTRMLLQQPNLIEYGAPMAAAPDPQDAEQRKAFRKQLAAQTEQLLWLAYRLQLRPLVQRMHSCVRAFAFSTKSVLCECRDAIFTPRVLEAAGVASLPAGKQMLINSTLGQMLSLADSTAAGPASLRPIGLTQQQQQPLKFDAVVNCSTLIKQAGATAAVELDLFNKSEIKIGSKRFAVQLRIGPYEQ